MQTELIGPRVNGAVWVERLAAKGRNAEASFVITERDISSVLVIGKAEPDHVLATDAAAVWIGGSVALKSEVDA